MHTYKIRPCYGRQELLVEFHPAPRDEAFRDDLLAALKASGARIVDMVDLVFDVGIIFDSSVGRFSIHQDEWGLWWGHASDNQNAIHFIDAALSASPQFTRVEADYSDYVKRPKM